MKMGTVLPITIGSVHHRRKGGPFLHGGHPSPAGALVSLIPEGARCVLLAENLPTVRALPSQGAAHDDRLKTVVPVLQHFGTCDALQLVGRLDLAPVLL